MPAARNFIDSWVGSVKPTAGKRVEYWDAQVPGLGLRVAPTGMKSWFFYGRQRIHNHSRNQVKQNLGRYPELTLTEARKRARNVKTKLERGIDPNRQIDFDKVKTIADAAEKFKELYIDRTKPRSAKEMWRKITVYVIPVIGDIPIDQIGRKDIKLLLENVSHKNGPIMANRVQAQLSRFFNWMIEFDLIETNPTSNITKAQERSRDRVLDDDEIPLVWAAAERFAMPEDDKTRSLRHPYGLAVQMLLLTGQRREEVFGMRWNEIDLKNKMWTIPKERTKNGLEHKVPLGDFALSILKIVAQMRQRGLVFAFSENKIYGAKSQAKKQLDKLCQLKKPWKLHDLRRTVATKLGQYGVDIVHTRRLLNHTPKQIFGITGVYNQHDYLPELRRVVTKWEGKLKKLIGKA